MKSDDEGYNARRRARQRAGYKKYDLHTGKLKAVLRAEGLLLEADLENAEAIEEAAAFLIDRYFDRISPSKEPRVPLKPYKAKRKPPRKRDPGRTLDREKIKRMNEDVRAGRRDPYTWKPGTPEELKAAQKERDEWTRKMNDLELQQHRRRVHLAEEKAKADADMLRQKFDAALVQAPKKRCFQPLGKSGISKRGGKPVTNGFGTHPAPKSFEGARIPQMTPAELKKAEKSLGVVDEPTANPHIVRVDVDALERMSGAVEAEAEGYGRRAGKRVRDLQNDEGTKKGKS